jgi:ribosomal protein S27E
MAMEFLLLTSPTCRRPPQTPNSYFMDVKCQGCFQMWVFSKGLPQLRPP